MSKPLVVVESPTKVRTIKKYIGDRFNVVATVGHIKDLPEKEMGIEIENGFQPVYRNIPGKQKIISSLKQAAGDTDEVFLAPDPDREGEAIAWHTAEVLKKRGRNFHRVLFHELTEKAIREAIDSPEPLNRNKFEAQQARRVLDRLVGYEISPLLWKKVKRGLSAGRVQSVAVRIICERERAIHAFEPEEYWSITALLEGSEPPSFPAKLAKREGKKIKIPDQDAAGAITSELSGERFVVDKVVKKTIRRNPLPPFTTSKLQQEAIRKLRFSAKKTMVIAQQLYEGIDLGPGEPVGLITYMRTDSTRISADAATDAIRMIRETYGDSYAIGEPRFFRNRKKVQDAHEAIRPTSVFNTPEKVATHLSKEQLDLYRLIWQRFIASQMAQALIDQVSVAIRAGKYQLTAAGSTIRFPGFMALYISSDDEPENGREKEILPDLKEGTELKLHRIDPRQHFTQPPPRFTEASLVKELEENGIGRPSTYAAILSTIREKEYVTFSGGYFRPSELGFIVNDLLVDNFSDILNVDFTSRMEDNLDLLESAEADYREILGRFYEPFQKELEAASERMLSVKGVGLPSGLSCPDCGGPLHIKVGKNGPFLACSKYPDCNFTRDFTRDEKGKIRPVDLSEPTDKVCEKCGREMVLKQGKFGKFLACTGYPECRTTQSITQGENGKETGVPCPEPGCTGSIVQKKSKRGKIFFGCNRFPSCSYAIWDKPVPRPCPECGHRFLVEKTTKREGTFLACPVETCAFREQAGGEDG